MKGTEQLKQTLLEAITNRVDTYAIQHSDGYTRISNPLTLNKYLSSDTTIGGYLVDLDGMVKCAVVDIDVNKEALNGDLGEFIPLLRDQATRIREVLKKAGFDVLTEFSGRKGYHLWIFFDEAVSATDVRYTLHTLEKDFQLVDDRLHWEIFPKQDNVDIDHPGSLIKLPLQMHKVSGIQTHFVDKDFEQIDPKVLPLNSKKLLMKAPSSKAEVMTFKGKSIDPFNMNLMFQKCHVLKSIEQHDDSSYLEGTTGHERRLFLGSQMMKFGEDGRKKVHEILKNEPDYNEKKTDQQLNSIQGPPQTCSYICKDKPCANICKVGGKSPIKFGYMNHLFPFLEKQTSSLAYYDWTDEHIYFVDSENKLRIIFNDADLKLGKNYPVRKVIFDPTSDITIDKESKSINLFKPTDHMVLSKSSQPVDLIQICPNILRLITNLIPKEKERKRFLNWISGIMQTREKQLTAWVFMGEPGAGKNVLLDHVLKPLFGQKQAIKVEDEQLKNPFNAWLQNALVIAFNEVAHDNRTRNSINSKIKAIITDNDMMINEKNVKVYTVDNHVNALFFSNNEIPVLIEENDRRFNVVRTGGNMRKNSWFSNPDKFFAAVATELPDFAQFLMNYSYNADLAKTVISNDQKKALVQAGMNRFEEFAKHLKKNDVEWINENTDDPFLITGLKFNGKIEKSKALSLFHSISGDDRIKMKKLTTELGLYGIKSVRERVGAMRTYYFKWDKSK